MATEDPAALQVPHQDVKQRQKPSVKGVATPEEETITLDEMKMLDRCRLQPDSADTERIITVLDETIVKLEMSSLIPHITKSLDRFADVLGPEITNSLMQHQKLSSKMEQLLANPEEEASVRAEEQQGCLSLLEKGLTRSVRDVLRLILANPSLCRALRQETWARTSPAEGFIKAFREFRNFMIKRLLMSPVEEEKFQLLEGISLQIKKNTEAITALQSELAAACQAGEEEIHKKDQVIEDLKTGMQDLAKDYKAGIQQINQEGDKQHEKELQFSQTKCARLQEDTEQLRAQLSALIREHQVSELNLKQRKRRVETEIVNWIQKYNTDMGEKQAEYEEVSAAYSKEKAQLSLLLEKRVLLLQEYSQIEEQRRIRQKEEEELNTKALAATRIQAFWRGYLVRSLFKKPKKDKGKKKGKKDKK